MKTDLRSNSNIRYFVADFETTVYKGQQNTLVWAASIVEMYTENVIILHSIAEIFNYLYELNGNIVVYFHNLKFDGSFWLSYLLYDKGMEQALDHTENGDKWLSDKNMKNNTFKYSISAKGQWYGILLKHKNYYIDIRDSLKLLPFSVRRIGESFGTKHKKLEMEYTGYRYPGCEITQEEQKYIANDVLVVKEALEIMFDSGDTSLTIGACCLKEFKRIMGKDDYQQFFPDLYKLPIPKNTFGSSNIGEYVRKSYKGAWCYLVKGKESKLWKNGLTADVNSLYPSMMSSESGNRYPVGNPMFWVGEIPDEAIAPNKYYFVRIKTRFYLKPGMLPFIQIKGNILYDGTEALETSDVWCEEDQTYHEYYYGKNGAKRKAIVTMTVTMTDLALIKEHYDLVDYEELDGCYFYSEIGIFDVYIEKYKQQKLKSKGALRELAKLFLNNLYGKMASSTDSSYKVAFLKPNGVIGFKTVEEHNKTPGYIPVGSAITSYARNFTIRAAQQNYHGVNKPGFIYADTDSIHCDLTADQIKGIKIHDKNFCCWKLESSWDKAVFVRQKTYIEHVVAENLEPIDKTYYNIKCAGMNEKSKKLLTLSIDGYTVEDYNKLEDNEKVFVRTKRDITDFKLGIVVPGKLTPKRILGGILLTETGYNMRF